MRTPTDKRPPTTPYVLARDEGEHFHFLNHLATVKVRSAVAESMGAVEFLAPHGFGPPLHLHEDEDELIVVLDGEMVFRSGEVETVVAAGGCAFLPRQIPHSFQVCSEEARFLAVTASATGRPRFDEFVADIGVPLATSDLPGDQPIDPARVSESGQRHGVPVLGPPPAVTS